MRVIDYFSGGDGRYLETIYESSNEHSYEARERETYLDTRWRLIDEDVRKPMGLEGFVEEQILLELQK